MQMMKLYHGSSTQLLPFQEFLPRMDGSGLVSRDKKYGGFFFAKHRECSEYFTEYLICQVEVSGVETMVGKSPVKVLETLRGKDHGAMIPNYLDGSAVSDIVVVPHSALNTIRVVHWELSCEEEEYHHALDEMFARDDGGDDPYIDRDYVDSVLEIVGDGDDYIKKFVPFKNWYDKLSHL